MAAFVPGVFSHASISGAASSNLRVPTNTVTAVVPRWSGFSSASIFGVASLAGFAAAAVGMKGRKSRGTPGSGIVRCATTVETSSKTGPTLHIGIVGYGLVGKALASQISSSAPRIEQELGVKVEISAVATSKKMVLLPPGLDTCFAEGSWPVNEVPADLNKLADHVLAAAANTGGRAVIVDNTASDEPVDLYANWLSAGASVVTPNKRAGSGPYQRYVSILEAAKAGGSQFLYESTVGAGLPILAPLQTLINAGDEIVAVEGILSGTLSYIFNTWKPRTKFSTVVADAKAKGFTEPDPRDDLSGTDVQRKVTILARQCGLPLELGDVPVKSLVPDALRSWTPSKGENLGDAFVKELEAYDDEMDELISDAEASGEILRFVGSIDLKAGTASVKLGRYPADHPFASTQFADNIVAFDTKWYNPRPLVIQGPGAGADVTAAGIFGNVVEVAKSMKQPVL